MKHTKEELKKLKFFKHMNQMYDRFFSNQKINLDQLKVLAEQGEIVLNPLGTTVFSSPEKVFEIIKSGTHNKKQLCIIRILPVRTERFLLEKTLRSEFEPVILPKAFDPNSRENKSLKSYIEKTVIENEKIYFKVKYSKGFRHPRVFCWIVNPEEGNSNWYLIYKPNKTYQEKDSELELYSINGAGSNKTYVPPYASQGTILILGRKK